MISNISPAIQKLLIIDFTGILIGLISIGILLYSLKGQKSSLKRISIMVMTGVLFNMMALTWTIVFARLKLFPAPAIDVHHLFMATGMIFFVVAVWKFSKIAKTLEKDVEDRTIEIEQAKQGLEKQVKERTASLEEIKSQLEVRVAERTEALQKQIEETGSMNKIMLGRETKMIELKKEIEALKLAQGKN